MIRTIEITIRLELNKDITADKAQELVNEMDYSFTDTTGIADIINHEVIDSDIEEEDEEEVTDKDRRHGTYGPEYQGEKF